MKKLAYIFMVFDTLEEYHVKKSIESFNLQDKKYIDTFIIYNNSTMFDTEWIKSLITEVNIKVIDKKLPTDKKMVSDNSGNEVVGMLMNDYMVKYEGRDNVVKKVKPKNKVKLDKRKDKKAF